MASISEKCAEDAHKLTKKCQDQVNKAQQNIVELQVDHRYEIQNIEMNAQSKITQLEDDKTALSISLTRSAKECEDCKTEIASLQNQLQNALKNATSSTVSAEVSQQVDHCIPRHTDDDRAPFPFFDSGHDSTLAKDIAYVCHLLYHGDSTKAAKWKKNSIKPDNKRV